jgi:hypothetical protein
MQSFFSFFSRCLFTAAHFIPDVQSMKKVKAPSLTASKEEQAYKQHKFVDDIATNPDMTQKVSNRSRCCWWGLTVPDLDFQNRCPRRL